VAKKRRKTGGGGGGASAAEQLFANAQTSWEEAEGRGSVFYPDDGEYAATFTTFETQAKQTKDGDDYLWFKCGFTINDEGKHEGRETGEVFNTLPVMVQGVETYVGLGRFKDVVSALNEDEIPEDLKECAEMMEALAGAETACNIRVSSNEGKNGKVYRHIHVIEGA